MNIMLPKAIVAAIDRYLAHDPNTDPSKLGALNAVAYIGEQLVALVQAQRAQRAREPRTVDEIIARNASLRFTVRRAYSLDLIVWVVVDRTTSATVSVYNRRQDARDDARRRNTNEGT